MLKPSPLKKSFLPKSMLEYKNSHDMNMKWCVASPPWSDYLKKAFQTFSMTRVLFCSVLPKPSTHDRPLKRFMRLAVNAPLIAASHHRITSPRLYWRYSMCWSFSRPFQNTASHLTQTQLWEQKEPSQQVDRLHTKQTQGGFTPLRATLEHLEWNQYAEFLNADGDEREYNTAAILKEKLFVWKYF